MAGVHITAPASHFFHFPPADEPTTLSPPLRPTSMAFPFSISPKLYNDMLSFQWPITIAAVYMTSVWLINGINKRSKNQPWGFSKTRGFFYFVVTHNVLLAVFSAWTTVGMFHAIKATLPGINRGAGLVGVIDSLCKASGPRGIGSAVTYSAANSTWMTTSRTVKLLEGGLPDTMDLGRLWNEGLGFYGWLFYLSKFYEVVDTLIILAKGKKSSFLQTYHHAGAMLCMWAGIRYMSPPIWLFVQINSFIHTIMYTYYAASALGVRVPMAFKRTLTTMQIIQIATGASYALIHLFISYDIPIERPYLFAQNLSTALPSLASSTTSTISSSLSSASSAISTAGTAYWLKKLALRAVGEEGLAENVRDGSGSRYGLDAAAAASLAHSREDVRWRWETTTVHCIDTSGQAFAILLNVVYLLPLTALFVRFFLKSYVYGKAGGRGGRGSASGKPTLRSSSVDAVKGVEREIARAMGVSAKQVGDSDPDSDVPVASKPATPPSGGDTSGGSCDSSAAKHGVNGAPDTPSTAKPKRTANGEGARFAQGKDSEKYNSGSGQGEGESGPRSEDAVDDTPATNGSSSSDEEARRAAEANAAEAVRRAYEAAAAAERDGEDDSIVSVETMRTTDSATGDLAGDEGAERRGR